MDVNYYFLDGRLVHQSLLPWRNVHEPWHTALQTTLGKTNALLFGLFLTIYVTFAGSRLWPVVRHLILPGFISHNSSDPVQEQVDELEQNQAIKLWLRYRTKSSLDTFLEQNPQLRAVFGDELERNQAIILWLRCRTESELHRVLEQNPRLRAALGDQDEQKQAIKLWLRYRTKSWPNRVLEQNPRLRAALGIAAVLNYLLSFVLGLLLLWLLTGLGTNAIVKSTSTTACAPFEAVGIDFRMAFTASSNYFQSCWLQNSESSLCKVSPSVFKPKIKAEAVDCPFSEAACLPGYESRLLTYEMTTESIGLNIPSGGMTLQHRLFYSAIDLSYFIAEKDGHPSLYFHDPHSDSWNNSTSRLIPFFTRRLQSLNGPSRLSSDYSGGIFDANTCHSTLKMEAEIFPGYHLANDADTEKLMHSLLKVKNGTVFALAVFHGLADYESPEEIIDPLFLAHRRKVNLYAPLYMPDHEANAIALKEQYRFCMEPSPENPQELCSPWQSNRWSPTKETHPHQGLDPTMAISKRFGDNEFPSDIMTALTGSNSTRWAYFTLFTQSSVEQFLRDNTKLPLSKMFQNVRIAPHIDPHNQTEHEVMAIFAMGYFQARFGMLQLVQKPMNGSTNCGAMLFSHPDYTNFSFLGILVVVVTFSSVVLAGYLFECLEVRREPWFGSLRDTLHRKLPWLPTVAHSRSSAGREPRRLSGAQHNILVDI
jgi:hypothetical protein